MKSQNDDPDHAYSLYEAILLLETPDEVRRFLKDLCTPSELKSFEERWSVAKNLDTGELSYRQINEKLGVSTTTIGRVSRFLVDEDYNGYRLVLDRIKQGKS